MRARSTPHGLNELALSATGEQSPSSEGFDYALRQAQAAYAQGALLAVSEDQLAARIDVLRQLGVDAETLSTALLYPLFSAGLISHEQLRPHVSARVLELIDGQEEAARFWAVYHSRGQGMDAEGLRRLLLVLVRDLRVVFILLASQLVAMRTAAQLDEAQRTRLARETADIHAPLANRLGIWQLKWELEDLTFRYLQPETYRRIASLLDERREDRENYIDSCVSALQSALAAAGIRGDVAGRPKHIYSIWKKMQRKALQFGELYDIRAIRVLVDDVPTCYAVLGLVHAQWPHVHGEFDDYITQPKGNNYQSLHTAVLGPHGKTVEVQIRTYDMHEHAERGVAAHWRYKEGGSGDASFERKIAWMRQLLENRDDDDDDASLLAGFRTDILEDRVYLLTPQGKVIDLPAGSTVLDFAYSVHTEIGHRCRGAKVNGRIVPLTFRPGSGDRVEVLTGKQPDPRRDWLSAHHGYLTSARARNKVRQFFRRMDVDRNVRDGREILERELKRVALPSSALEQVPERFNLRSVDDLCVAVALGDLSSGQVVAAVHALVEPRRAPELPQIVREKGPAPPSDRDAVTIEGVGNLLTQMAGCCKPVPGDPITGFITRGRGVSIHRSDCANLLRLIAREPGREVEVQWGGRRVQRYPVDLRVRALDRKSLLKDISTIITSSPVRMSGVNTRGSDDDGVLELHFALQVGDYAQLSELISKLSALPNVLEVQRLA